MKINKQKPLKANTNISKDEKTKKNKINKATKGGRERIP